jgi:hypothetical protein
MDLEVIAGFKKLYTRSLFRRCFEACQFSSTMTLKTFWKEKFDILEAIWLIQKALSEVTQLQLNSTWRKHCPSCVQGDGDDVPEIMDGIVTTTRDLELEVNEVDIEELLMEHEDDLTTEELQEIQRDVSPEKEENEKGPMPTSAIKYLLMKWEDGRTTVLEWHPNHVEVSSVGISTTTMSFITF